MSAPVCNSPPSYYGSLFIIGTVLNVFTGHWHSDKIMMGFELFCGVVNNTRHLWLKSTVKRQNRVFLMTQNISGFLDWMSNRILRYVVYQTIITSTCVAEYIPEEQLRSCRAYTGFMMLRETVHHICLILMGSCCVDNL